MGCFLRLDSRSSNGLSHFTFRASHREKQRNKRTRTSFDRGYSFDL